MKKIFSPHRSRFTMMACFLLLDIYKMSGGIIMTFRRAILIILLIVLSMLLIYNSYIAPLFVRNYNQMGMGMHGRMWQSYNYGYNFVDFNLIVVLIVVIAGIFLYDILTPKSSIKRCNHCGHIITSDKWSICPICGRHIK